MFGNVNEKVKEKAGEVHEKYGELTDDYGHQVKGVA
ncbi:CsbD family protein, partial [Salmonella enterica subsp. enterica serovar Bredeney]|nr:CsbD family protein [Salmonella enterica subsp. enterica serovar Bredeney]